MKRCTKCLIYKPDDGFNKNKNTKDGLEYTCKVCKREYDVVYKKENIDRRRECDRLRYYEIDNQQYDSIFSEQGGVCKICGVLSDKTLHVDHDHESGTIRGLLCGNCNRALGYAKDDPRILRKMADYIESGEKPWEKRK